jgi:hypothetical protein
MHDYQLDCQCYRCKGIRSSPGHKSKAKRGLLTKKPVSERKASRSEQHARYLDCGPGNWDDR